MKILVTGGGGFLGSAICRQLLSRGEEVLAFQRSPSPALVAAGAQVISGDVLDAKALHPALQGCDAVIHTAGKAGIWGDYEQYHDINVKGTEAALDGCLSQGIRFFVHTSSPSVVHGGGDIEGGDESLPYPAKFTSAYPATKAIAEQRVLAANGDQIRTVALRPHLIWGPGDPHLLPRLIEKAQGGRLLLPGADKLIDTVYIDNAAQAHVLALDRLMQGGGCAGKKYFISNDDPRPQREIIGLLLHAVGYPVPIKPVSPRLALAGGQVCEWAWKGLRLSGEPPLTCWSAEQLSTAHWYDLSAAREDLGYRADISIETGLQRLRAHHA